VGVAGVRFAESGTGWGQSREIRGPGEGKRLSSLKLVLVLASADGVAGITAGATLTAALGLAFVTIYTTNRRLSEERDRHIRDLDHDRELTDLSDLRALLDEAAVAIDQARAARLQAERMATRASVQGISQQQRQQYAREASKELEQTVRPLVAMNARLRVRLGADDPITTALDQAANHLQIMNLHTLFLQWIDDANQDDDALAKTKKRGSDFVQASEMFLAAAAQRAGARI
jgi:hypothetical protein